MGNDMLITWQSPSNIALIKYWGKHGIQLPKNPSLSLTLNECATTTSLITEKKKTKKETEVDFYFEGKKNKLFADRITKYVSSIQDAFPFVRDYRLRISSENSFPHSAGIASSASSMSALALCLMSACLIHGKPKKTDFFREASKYARLGSGSASRSVYGEFVLWGNVIGIKNSSDEFAVRHPLQYHSEFNDLQDTILVVHSGIKSVSSRAGHALMENHPMSQQRYSNAHERLNLILKSLKTGDWDEFISVTEAEALELHALMMTSTPSYLLMEPATITLIQKIRQFRKETKIPVCFTLDAGPNVHVIYPYFHKTKVRNFIQNELLPFCDNGKIIYDAMGQGPKQILTE